MPEELLPDGLELPLAHGARASRRKQGVPAARESVEEIDRETEGAPERPPESAGQSFYPHRAIPIVNTLTVGAASGGICACGAPVARLVFGPSAPSPGGRGLG